MAGWATAWRVSSLLAAAALAVVVVSGVVDWFVYRPSDPPVVAVHAWSARLLLLAGLAAAISGVGAVRSAGRIAMVGVAVPVLAALGGISGLLLAWDQLALWAVTVGTRFDGVDPMFGEQIRFVIVDGTEVSVSTYRRWAVAHVLLGVALVVPVASGAVRR